MERHLTRPLTKAGYGELWVRGDGCCDDRDRLGCVPPPIRCGQPSHPVCILPTLGYSAEKEVSRYSYSAWPCQILGFSVALSPRPTGRRSPAVHFGKMQANNTTKPRCAPRPMTLIIGLGTNRRTIVVHKAGRSPLCLSASSCHLQGFPRDRQYEQRQRKAGFGDGNRKPPC